MSWCLVFVYAGHVLSCRVCGHKTRARGHRRSALNAAGGQETEVLCDLPFRPRRSNAARRAGRRTQRGTERKAVQLCAVSLATYRAVA